MKQGEMMKKILVFLVITLASFLVVGCQKDELLFQKKNLTNYSMQIEMDDDGMSFSAKQVVDYINNSDQIFEQLSFHLYPSAFREGASQKVISLSAFTKAYYDGQNFSTQEITNVDVLGQEQTEFEIAGTDYNILRVSLDEKLYPKDRVKIEMVYNITLPKINHRFGVGKNTINVGNFFPIACVYEDGKFMESPYSSNGDPFYSDMANFEVSLSYNEKFELATCGSVQKTTETNGKKTSLISASVIRDFAFVLSENFKVIKQDCNGVDVLYYYFDELEPEKSLEVSVLALKTFSEKFGAYPYKTLSVVKASFVHGGMEYPTLVYIADDIKEIKDYHNVIVHEIAHQWWYGMVGSNAFAMPWLDEGLTDYSTALFYELNPQYERKLEDIMLQGIRTYAFFVDAYTALYKTVDQTMDRALDEYMNENEYVYITYVKGMLLFDGLRKHVGDTAFFKSLQTYFKTYKFENAKVEDMIACFERVTKRSLESFFSSWIDGKVVIMQAAA
jgi:hypothetical protein